MTGKSLANDFECTKLKYKQYLYFNSNVPLMFLLCFFLFSLFISIIKYSSQECPPQIGGGGEKQATSQFFQKQGRNKL